MKPTPYSREAYAQWHEGLVEADRGLVDRLDGLRRELMDEARGDLDLLYRVLTYMFKYAGNEYRNGRGEDVRYATPLEDVLKNVVVGGATAGYDDLFKSVPSIVNKMWRRADDEGPRVTLSNVRDEITDLVRTDVRAETLDGARFLAHRMNNLPNLLYAEDLKRSYMDAVESVAFEPEMKMAAGYFAYHGLVRFRSGVVVEVQIHSALMSEWRKLSHRLYERVRLEPVTKHEFASPEARLISLGHVLHMAECEIMRLRQEIERGPARD